MVEPLILLAAAAGLGYMYVTPKVSGFTENENSIMETYNTRLKDKYETGFIYDLERTGDHQLVFLNDAWKPRSAPRQDPTDQVTDIFRDQSEIDTYLEKYGPQFWFLEHNEIPLTSAQQSNPNVELPSENSSIQGDPGNSLLYYPRAYIDKSFPPETPNTLFTGQYGTMRTTMEPEEFQEVYVPPQGKPNTQHSVYGPGGAMQRLMSNINEIRTRTKGADQTTILGQNHSSGFLSYIYNQRL